MSTPFRPFRAAALALLPLFSFAAPESTRDPHPTLQQAAAGLFTVGVALNASQIVGDDSTSLAIVRTHFNSLTAENAMKWQHLQPAPGRFDFALADRFVKLGQRRRAQVIGHTLVWHAQTPDWLFKNADGSEVTRDELIRRLRTHIATVVGRYRGKVSGWDVVNEAIRDEDGTLRTDKPWYRILGEEAVFVAFEAAHEADPAAELYYNDYSLENPVKRAGVLKLVQAIRAHGLRIDGVGSQGHFGLDWPKLDQLDASIADFSRAGFKVMFTELDVSVLPRPANYVGAEISTRFEGAAEFNPYPKGLPAEQEAALARRYTDLFAIFLKHRDAITRVTLWGVTDRSSWLNNWPIRGRTDYPLLFDRAGNPKPALDAVIQTLRAGPPTSALP